VAFAFQFNGHEQTQIANSKRRPSHLFKNSYDAQRSIESPEGQPWIAPALSFYIVGTIRSESPFTKHHYGMELSALLRCDIVEAMCVTSVN